MHYSCFAVLSVVMCQIMFVFICELIQYKNKWHLISIGNPTMEIRRSYDRLITTMISPILVRRYVYIQSRTWISSVALRQLHHGSLCVWAQSMRNSLKVKRHLLLAGCKHLMTPVYGHGSTSEAITNDMCQSITLFNWIWSYNHNNTHHTKLYAWFTGHTVP